jgi:hypothetical protein
MRVLERLAKYGPSIDEDGLEKKIEVLIERYQEAPKQVGIALKKVGLISKLFLIFLFK